MIVTPDILGQVAGQSFPPDASLGRQAAFQVAPEALQSIDVAAPAVAERLAVIYQPVDIAPGCDTRVAEEGVRADDRAELHPLVEEWQQGLGLYVGHDLCTHLSPSAQDAKDCLFAGSPASPGALDTFSEALVAPGTS